MGAELMHQVTIVSGAEMAHRRADAVLTRAAAIVLVGLVAWVNYTPYADNEPIRSAAAETPGFVAVTPSPITFTPVEQDQSECLAEVLYYEARGEGMEGEKAVAEVVLQRTRDRNYPRTICGVVYEGVQPHTRSCQFSFACDGALKRPKEPTTWMRVRNLADAIVSGAVRLAGETRHAVAFHSVDVEPAWAGDMVKTAQIGNHIFYRRDPNARLRAEQRAQSEAAASASDDGQMTAEEPQSDEVEPDVQTADAVSQGA